MKLKIYCNKIYSKILLMLLSEYIKNRIKNGGGGGMRVISSE